MFMQQQQTQSHALLELLKKRNLNLTFNYI